MLQVVPFHRSARLPALDHPAAVHADGEVQATEARTPPPCGGLGVGWMLQRVPSHRSASVLAPGVKFVAPTAVHADADVHATPLRTPAPCSGLGVAWMVQRVPSHRSARVPALDHPTAVHADADVQATAPRRPPPCGGCTSWGRCQFRSVDPSGLISDP